MISMNQKCLGTMMKYISENFKNIQTFIFDLDYVLFNEDLYYFAVFEKVSDFLGLDSRSLNLMKKTYKKNKLISKDILGDILKSLNLYTPQLQEKFYEFYKNTYVPLSLYKDAKETLSILRKKNHKLGIITNGTLEAQKNKIKCLGIERFFDEILYAREFGKRYEKPHVKPFIEICKRLKIKPYQSVYIGDNPVIDFIGAKKVGFVTIRVLRGAYKEFKSKIYVDYEINNLYELLGAKYNA